MKRVIVSGTRKTLLERDERHLDDALWAATRCHYGTTELGVGDCPTGVDLYAREWGAARVFRADWQAHGKAAGPRRNAEMVAWAAEADEALLIAMPAPSSRGTWGTIRRAVSAGIPVVIVPKGGKPWPT